MIGKDPPIRLDAERYGALMKRILERDRWRCQFCGAQVNLQVHHIVFRSQGGSDSEANLITACAECHRNLHT